MNPYEIAAFSVLGLGILLSWLSFRYQLGLLCECIEGLVEEIEEDHDCVALDLHNADSFARGKAKISEGNFQLLFDTLTYLAAETKVSLTQLAAETQSAVSHFNECSDSLEGHAISLRTQAQAHADRTEAQAFSRFTREVPERKA